MKYYGYILEKEKKSGVLTNWGECQQIVSGKNAKYKSFPTKIEAENWIKSGGISSPSSTNKKPTKYYAYYKTPSINGISTNWEECKNIVENIKPRYKSFLTEREAKEWIKNHGQYEPRKLKTRDIPFGIFFDAGTGRGLGVEVRVTDREKNSLIYKVAPSKINEFGNIQLLNKTNNYGELLGCYLALKIALESGEKNIYGDSKLILEYWSKGHGSLTKLEEETTKLIQLTKILREEFERKGGKLSHISGDINPADLGFHR